MTVCFQVNDGVVLHFYPSSSEPLHIQIGVTTAQDLACELGPPPRVNYREDDRMTIHSRASKLDEELGTSCLSPLSLFCMIYLPGTDFYNYFQYGIDFLISGTNHVVKKIILHSNLVGACVFTSHISFLTPPISQGLHCFNNTSDARGQSRGSQKMTKMVRPPGHHFYLLTHLTLHGRFSTSEMVL